MTVILGNCCVLGFYKKGYFKKLFIFFLSYQLIFSTICFSQRHEIDSLKKILPSLNDTSRIDCINALSFQYIRLLVRDSAKYFEALAYKESKALGYIQGIAVSITNQSGIVEYFDNDFVKSEALARESLRWFEKTTNKNGIEKIYDNLWFAAFGQSKYDEAYQIAKWKYEKSLIAKDTSAILDALQGLGVIHYQEGNYDSAFYYYQKVHQIAIIQKNDVWLSDDLKGFGTIYRAIGDYNSALNYYREIFRTDTRETIQSRIDGSYETWTRMEYAELFGLLHQYDSAWHYYHLFDTTKITDKDLRVYLVSTGETYLLQEDYKKALQNFLRGLVMHRKLNDRNEIKRTLLDIAKTYFALGNYRAALQYARDGVAMSLQTKSRQFVRDGYQIICAVYDKLQITDSAYFYFKKYINIKDVVVSDQTKGKYAAYKYEQQISLMNNEKLISLQQLKIQRQMLASSAFQKRILIIGLVCLVIVCAIIFRNITLKRKSERHLRELAENDLQIQNLEHEKKSSELKMQALRAQMNPHFIFNSLNSINRFILQNNKAEAEGYLTKFSRLIRMILNSSANETVSLAEDLDALKLYLELECLRFDNAFSYQLMCDPEVDADFIRVPPMLLQPFVENAIWHGLMNKKEKGHVWINIDQEDATLICTITDDGIGRKKATELKGKSGKYKSMGMNITESRIAMMNKMNGENKSVEIRDLVCADGSAGGTEVILKIPVAEYE